MPPRHGQSQLISPVTGSNAALPEASPSSSDEGLSCSCDWVALASAMTGDSMDSGSCLGGIDGLTL